MSLRGTPDFSVLGGGQEATELGILSRALDLASVKRPNPRFGCVQ